jgi:hypothetical protein
MRFVFVVAALFMAVMGILQWRQNERSGLAEATSPLDRRLKQAIPVGIFALAGVALLLAVIV